MEILLKPKSEFQIPLEADVISPDNFVDKSIKEIEDLTVLEGNVEKPLKDFFDVSISPSATSRIVIDGDVERVKYIGKEMSFGEIVINGNAGLQLGSEMKGGRIIVNGDVLSWLGMEMENGSIHVKGNAGDYVGCAYRGEWRGMKGGEITIDGSAGDNIGGAMIDGTIKIQGNVGNFCGVKMKGGEIIVRGGTGRAIGAEMTGGKIMVFGKISKFLPGFEYSESMSMKDQLFLGFKGDYSEINPNGKLYVSYNENKNLIMDVITKEEDNVDESGFKAIYNSGSTITQGKIIKGGKKLMEEYMKECATCHINPADYESMGKPLKVVVSCGNNEVVLRAVKDDGVQHGNIFIPRGIWANVITPAATETTGSPMYKGVEVDVKPAPPSAKILCAEEIIEKMR